MIWLVIALLALALFAAVMLLCKPPLAALQALGAALLFGLTGYALQGSPSQPGAPTQYNPTASFDPALWVTMRQQFSANEPVHNKWLLIGDALVRHGDYAEAVAVMQGSVRKQPKANRENAEIWLATGNALVGHAQGLLTPAAEHAYVQAARLAPDHPGVPYFHGLAMAQTGRFGEARKVWGALLATSKPDAAWRADLENKLARLDQLIVAQNAGNMP